jgi:phosphoglycerate kinase
MAKQTVRDLDVKGKRVIVRVDFNVPIKDGKIKDDNRIVQALPTIDYLIEHGARIILMSHLGKVEHKDPVQRDIDMAKNEMSPVAARLARLVKTKVSFVPVTRGAPLEEAVANLKDGEIVVMQNTRYEKGESKNDPELSKYWASLGDLFVTDAFGSVHRAHSSTVGIAEYLPSALGFLVEKEVEMLTAAVYNPKRPFVAILGGAKVSDKIAVIENLLTIADKVLVGGGMAYTFLKAQGKEIGKSLLEEDRLEMAADFLNRGKGKLVLPVDHVAASAFAEDATTQIVDNDHIPADALCLDIGPKTIELFKHELQGAKTVVWNGPMGVFEMKPFAKGTLEICTAISELPGAMTVIGGGDSAAAAIQLGFGDKFTHISTGGGASLEFMEGKELPGIAIIQEKK